MKLPVQSLPILQNNGTTITHKAQKKLGITDSLSLEEAACRIDCASQYPDAAAPNAILCSRHCQNVYGVKTIL